MFVQNFIKLSAAFMSCRFHREQNSAETVLTVAWWLSG